MTQTLLMFDVQDNKIDEFSNANFSFECPYKTTVYTPSSFKHIEARDEYWTASLSFLT